MKVSFLATAFAALIATSNASILRRQFSPTDVQDFVVNWQTDVTNVNNFLNGVFEGTLSTADPDTLVQNAQLAKTFASDEPMELMRLGSLPGLSQQGINAAMNLMQVFGPGVLDNLDRIIASPGDAAVVTDAVQQISDVRCFNVLIDLCNLFPAAFTAVGLDPAQAAPPRFEEACTGIYANAGVTPLCQNAVPVIQTTS